MTVHGWVDGDEGKINFPNLNGSFICWNVDIEEWCGRQQIKVEHRDPFWAYAYLTKQQILDLATDVYGAALNYGKAGEASIRAWPRNIANLFVDLKKGLGDVRLYKLSGFDY